MKKEDIKKLWKDVNFVCVRGKVNNLFFGFVFLFVANFYPQSKINNFGNLKIIKTLPDFSKILLTDFNRDGLKDFFIFSNKKKYYLLHTNIADSIYSAPHKFFFKYPLDDIKLLSNDKKENYFVFVSRNKRVLGLATFDKKNKLRILSRIKFNSHPSSIKIVDLNNDGKNEALIYGNNFDGLTLVYNKKKKIIAKKLLSRMAIKSLDVVDFNQDNLQDIVLVDLINNSLKFYETYSLTKLNFNREIEFENPVYKIKKVNFNNDDFEDLILSQKRMLQVFFGDSVYSFSKTKKISFDITPDNFFYVDIDHNGKKEIILTDKKNRRIAIESNPTEENNYFFNGLSDVDIVEDTAASKLVALSNTGEIFLLSVAKDDKRSFDYLPAGKPTAVKFNGKLKNFEIAFFDSFANTVNFYTVPADGKFYLDKKFFMHNDITDFKLNKNRLTIVGYKKSERLLEIKSNEKNSNGFIYSGKPLESVKFTKRSNILALELENGKLYSQKFQYKQKKYFDIEPKFIDSLVTAVSFGKKGNEIYYWKKPHGKLLLKKFPPKISKNILSIDIQDSNNISMAFINGKSKNYIYTIVKNKNDINFYSIQKKFADKYEIKGRNIFEDELDAKDFVTFYDKKKNKFKLFYLNRRQNILYELTLNKKKRKFEKTKEIKVEKVKDFYVDKILGKTYFVFTNSNNYAISFRILE